MAPPAPLAAAASATAQGCIALTALTALTVPVAFGRVGRRGPHQRHAGQRRGAAALAGALLLAALLLSGCGGGGGSADGAATASASSFTGGGGAGSVPPATDASAEVLALRPGVLSVSTSPRLDPAPVDAADAAARATEAVMLPYLAGARGLLLAHTWRDLEPAPGQYSAERLAQLREALTASRANGLTPYLALQVIDTHVKAVPADLADTPFDDPRLRQRLRALLDVVVGGQGGLLPYLAIGNEVDAYLAGRPVEASAYLTMFREAVAHVHALDPAVRVGVSGIAATATATDVASRPGAALLQALLAASDVAMLTYYPVQTQADGAVQVRPTAEVAEDFRRMLAWAGDKPLLLQEVGYPASAVVGSSAAQQAEFVQQVFRAWRRAPAGRISYLNVFMLHDYPTALCDRQLAYYGLAATPGLHAALCSLGLREANGTARPAWDMLVQQARQAQLP